MLEHKEICAESTQIPTRNQCTVFKNATEKQNIKNLEKSFDHNKERVIKLLSNAIKKHKNIQFNLKLRLEYEILLDTNVYEIKEIIHQTGIKKLHRNDDICKTYREKCHQIVENVQYFVERNSEAKRRRVKDLTIDIYKYIVKKQTSKDAEKTVQEKSHNNTLQSSSTNIPKLNFDGTVNDLQITLPNVHLTTATAKISNSFLQSNSMPIYDLTNDNLQSLSLRGETSNEERSHNCISDRESSLHISDNNCQLINHCVKPQKGTLSSLEGMDLQSNTDNVPMDTFDDIEIVSDEDPQSLLPNNSLTTRNAISAKEACLQTSTLVNDIPMKTSASYESSHPPSTEAETSKEKISEKKNFPSTSTNVAIEIFDSIENVSYKESRISLTNNRSKEANTIKDACSLSICTLNNPNPNFDFTETVSNGNSLIGSTVTESYMESTIPYMDISDNNENISLNTSISYPSNTAATPRNINNPNVIRFRGLPNAIILKRACISVFNKDIYSFKWAIISALKPDIKNSHRCSSYKIDNISNDIIELDNNIINFKGLNFPYTTLDDVKLFETLNPQISVNVFGLLTDNETVGVYYMCETVKPRHINLLLVRQNGNSHYSFIKNLSRLFKSQLTKHCAKLLICNACLSYFHQDSALAEHVGKHCKTEGPRKKKKIQQIKF